MLQAVGQVVDRGLARPIPVSRPVVILCSSSPARRVDAGALGAHDSPSDRRMPTLIALGEQIFGGGSVAGDD